MNEYTHSLTLLLFGSSQITADASLVRCFFFFSFHRIVCTPQTLFYQKDLLQRAVLSSSCCLLLLFLDFLCYCLHQSHSQRNGLMLPNELIGDQSMQTIAKKDQEEKSVVMSLPNKQTLLFLSLSLSCRYFLLILPPLPSLFTLLCYCSRYTLPSVDPNCNPFLFLRTITNAF